MTPHQPIRITVPTPTPTPTTGPATPPARQPAPEQRSDTQPQPGDPLDHLDTAGTHNRIRIRDLTATYDGRPAVAGVNLTIAPREITALIGPSGCGKSTLLRCLNGMHLTNPKAGVTGQVLLGDTDIYNQRIELVALRRRVGMVFQRPNPFPTMTIYDNVAAGLKLGARGHRRPNYDQVVERALIQAQLWDEVKNRLNAPGGGLSGGQQQRLCIARAIAVAPDVLLMDEPCSALDPISTLAIEDLLKDLKQRFTIAIVTHNMQQAARVSDTTAFLTVPEPGHPGTLIEAGPTDHIFSTPTHKATEDYISGRFG